MKVLIINGSPRVNGNTAIAVNEMAGVFHAEGVETDIVQVGNKDVRGCIACGQCAETAVRQHLMSSTNILPSLTCQLLPASTGTAFTAGSLDRRTWTRKESRQCARSQGT